jgi:hypothetical protein
MLVRMKLKRLRNKLGNVSCWFMFKVILKHPRFESSKIFVLSSEKIIYAAAETDSIWFFKAYLARLQYSGTFFNGMPVIALTSSDFKP